jgi:hypothetical protein
MTLVYQRDENYLSGPSLDHEAAAASSGAVVWLVVGDVPDVPDAAPSVTLLLRTLEVR